MNINDMYWYLFVFQKFYFLLQPLDILAIPPCFLYPLRLFLDQFLVFIYLFTNDFYTVAVFELSFQSAKIFFVGLSLHFDISVFQVIFFILVMVCRWLAIPQNKPNIIITNIIHEKKNQIEAMSIVYLC